MKDKIRKFIDYQTKQFISDKDETEIKLSLLDYLNNREWCGKCPAPLGWVFYKRLLMFKYIPNETKQVCEEYLIEEWDTLNESQRITLKNWISELSA